MADQQRTTADDIQVTVPLRRLEQLLELPGEVAQLRKDLAQLKRRVDGGDGIHYDLMCKIKDLQDML